MAFIVSANIARRNLSKGQQAMVLAMIYPEPERGRGKKDEARKHEDTSPFSYRRLQQARAVLRLSAQFDTKMASAVVAGDLSLGMQYHLTGKQPNPNSGKNPVRRARATA